jgi:hypothetical protein
MKTPERLIHREEGWLHHNLSWIMSIFLLAILWEAPWSAPSLAQESDRELAPVGPEPQSITTTAITTLANDQLVPQAAYAGSSGTYLVVFEHVYSSTDHDIYARRVGSDGTPSGGEFGVVTTTSSQINPTIAFNPETGETLVVWEHVSSATDHDIHGRLVSAAGVVEVTELIIAATSVMESHPVVTYNPSSGEYLVVWEHLSGADEFTQNDIYAQRLHPLGVLIGDPILMATSSLDERRPAVAFGSSDYLIAWQGRQPSSTEYGIYAQRLSGLGSLVGSQIGISTWEGDQLSPRLAYNSIDSNFLVVWEDHHYAYPVGWGIYAQRLDTSGGLVGAQIPVATGGEKNRLNPEVTFSSQSRSFLVAWEFEYATSDHDVYSRRVAYDGTQPESQTVLTNLGSHEMHPALAAGGETSLLAVWEDYRDSATQGINIYGTIQTLNIPVLSGNVYSGTIGVETDPLSGVTIQLYCSNDLGSLGDLVSTTTTNETGWYGLPAYGLCEYYHILETDPTGYFSVGSSTVSGVVVNSNWIYYNPPLASKTQTGNNFWDYPEGPSDTLPPGNWANFSPSGWINLQTANTSVQVEDTLSGLDVDTAEFSYSLDGGSAWSIWQPASCTGTSGTTDPQTISASVPFGQDSGASGLNKVRFRASDRDGNLGQSPDYTVQVDTVLPQNPTTVTCPGHPVNTWVSVNQMTCQWSGATDGLSGVDGYSVDWDAGATSVPAPTLEIHASQADSGPLSDSGSWYFHVRTIDAAGNAATGATHYGPMRIDTTAPTAWITAPAAGGINTTTFNVTWTGQDTHAGITTYDVQKSADGMIWSNWKMGVSYTSASYTGTRGESVSFRVRARDAANNLGSWSSPREITIGVNLTVQVENESGTPLSSAEVYLNQTLQGETYGNGTLTVYNALLGDQLSARYLIEQHLASKGYHNWLHGPNSWSYRTYITSVGFDNTGNPQIQTVSNTATTQIIQVRKDNAQVGFYVLVSVEWDASSTFLNELRTGFLSASDYLYDLTDGQMLFEVIDIWDNKARWNEADFRIHASNQEWPHASVGGIWEGTDKHAYLGRFFDGQTSNTGPWTQSDAFRTLIHEFGHYGFDLYDEYLNSSGGKDGQGCTIDRATTPVDVQASFMDYQYTATEMCSSLTLHPHNTNTHQHGQNGEPCWDTVYDRYKDTQNPPRWIIERPNDRGSIMAGPTAVPIADWTATRISGLSTSVCAPFNTAWIYQDGSAALDFDTWVEGGVQLYQGKTVSDKPKGVTPTAGLISILGAHNGDTVRVHKDCGWFCSYSGSTTASCTTTSSGLEQAPVAINGPPLILEQDPFALEVSSQVLGDGTTLNIEVQASILLPAPPEAQVWQDGNGVITVPLTFDGVKYTGSASLDPGLALTGEITAKASDGQGHTVDVIAAFNAQRVEISGLTWLISSDGLMEIFLPAGSLSGDPIISIQPVSQPSLEQDGLIVVGRSYKVIVSSGVYNLNLPASLNIFFSPEQIAQLNSQSLGLYRWDGLTMRWVLVGEGIDLEHYFVSAQVSQLGTFAILGSPERLLFLPLVDNR